MSKALLLLAVPNTLTLTIRAPSIKTIQVGAVPNRHARAGGVATHAGEVVIADTSNANCSAVNTKRIATDAPEPLFATVAGRATKVAVTGTRAVGKTLSMEATRGGEATRANGCAGRTSVTRIANALAITRGGVVADSVPSAPDTTGSGTNDIACPPCKARVACARGGKVIADAVVVAWRRQTGAAPLAVRSTVPALTNTRPGPELPLHTVACVAADVIGVAGARKVTRRPIAASGAFVRGARICSA